MFSPKIASCGNITRIKRSIERELIWDRISEFAQYIDANRLTAIVMEGEMSVIRLTNQMLISNTSIADMERTAHELNATAGTLGLEDISRIACKVERLCRIGDTSTIEELISLIQSIVPAQLEALNLVMSEMFDNVTCVPRLLPLLSKE